MNYQNKLPYCDQVTKLVKLTTQLPNISMWR